MRKVYPQNILSGKIYYTSTDQVTSFICLSIELLQENPDKVKMYYTFPIYNCDKYDIILDKRTCFFTDSFKFGR